MAVTYSSGSGRDRAITTVDLHHGCTSQHTGTSASSPLAAGVVALVLQANAKLNWREVQHVLIRSARQVGPDGEWTTNGAGFRHSYNFGFGVLDAGKAVDLAESWQPIGERLALEQTKTEAKNIPYASGPEGALEQTVVVTSSSIAHLEHVQVTRCRTCGNKEERALSLSQCSRSMLSLGALSW